MFRLLPVLSLCFLFFAAGACSSSDNAWYVDATHGDDANSGESAEEAWQTLGKAAGFAFPAEGRLLLKRGETWYEQLDIASDNLTIDAYGEGELPIIDGSREISSWNAVGNGIYSAVVDLGQSEALGNVSQDGVLMNFAAWVGDWATSLSSQPESTYTFDYPNRTVYIKTPSLKSYRVSVKLFGIDATDRTQVEINNVRIRRFSLHGVHFKNCHDCSIRDSAIDSGGGAFLLSNPSAPPDYIYAGNGIDFANSARNGVVEKVSVQNIFDSCVAVELYESNQAAEGFTISNSTAEKCGFAGVEISLLSNGGKTGSKLDNVSLTGLTITDSGKGFSNRRYGTEGHGIRLMADEGTGTMSGLIVDKSVVRNSAGAGIKMAGEIGLVDLSQLSLTGNEFGINVSDVGSTTLELRLTASLIFANGGYGVAYNAPTAAGFSMINNTFSNNTAINVAVFNQTGKALIKNNLFFADADKTHLFVSGALVGASINHNCYQTLNNSFGYNSLAYATLDDFRTATGFEDDGLAGDVGLANPGAGDFALKPASICRGLGDASVGVATDYLDLPFANPPSSGALEYY